MKTIPTGQIQEFVNAEIAGAKYEFLRNLEHL